MLLTTHQYDAVIADLAFMSQQLAADLRGTIHVTAKDESRDRDQQSRIVVRHADFAQTSPEPDPAELYTDVLLEG